MYSVAVSDHFMMAHSLRGAVFGPAQALHGATYAVEAMFCRATLDPDNIVVDIGAARTVLQEILAVLNYRNLDAMAAFAGQVTTTEFLARHIFDSLATAIRRGRLGAHTDGLASLRVTLTESPVAKAAYEGPLGR